MGWQVLENPKRLSKTFSFPDFKEALAFADRVGALAEEKGHHPRLIVEWGRVTVEWWTHTKGGIAEKDREMAGLTDALYAP